MSLTRCVWLLRLFRQVIDVSGRPVHSSPYGSDPAAAEAQTARGWLSPDTASYAARRFNLA
jgi:hypothetical protein